MHEKIVRLDWRTSGVPDVEYWPHALKDIARTTLLSPTPMALLIGGDGIFFYNDALATILSDEHYRDALGRPVYEIMPAARPFLTDILADARRGRPTSRKDEAVRFWRDGREQLAWFDLDFSAVVDETGEVHAVLMVAAETTARVTAMRELRSQHDRLDFALDAGGLVGVWEVDFATEIVRSDERFALLHGVPAVEARAGTTREAFQAGIHPDDLMLVNEAFDVAKFTGHYRCVHRVTGSGEARWIVASGQIRKDALDRPVSFAGIAVDVTQQVEATNSLAESERRFRSFTESMPQIVFSVNASGRPEYVNPRWYDYTGLPADQFIEDRWQTLLHPDDRETLLPLWRDAVLKQRLEVFDLEIRLRHHSGEYRWCRAIVMPTRAPDGGVSGWVGTLTDIHEARMLQAERELVSRELDHRMKNFFAVASGLVKLTGRDTADVEVFQRRLTERLRALNAAHGFINRSGQVHEVGRRYSLRGLLEQLLEPFSDREAIAVAGDDVEIAGGNVTALSLVFHELATNAAKYGGLAHPGGSLTVALARTADTVTIQWDERFEAVKADSEPGGFGSRLLSLVVETQLGGRLERALQPDTLLVRIDLPIVRIEG